MSKIEKFKNVYEIIIGTIASIISLYLLNTLQDQIPKSKSIRVVFVIIIVSVIVILTNLFISTLINKNAKFRKLIDNANFIEGFWYDITIENGNFIHIVLLSISYDDSAYKMCGENFDKNLNKIATFNSTQISFVNQELLAKLNVKYGENNFETSYEHLNFTDNNPDSYSGCYIDLHTSPKFVHVNGIKVTDHEIKQYKKFKSLNKKKEFLRTCLNSRNIS